MASRSKTSVLKRSCSQRRRRRSSSLPPSLEHMATSARCIHRTSVGNYWYSTSRTTMLQQHLDVAIAAAKAAGGGVLPLFCFPLPIERKSDHRSVPAAVWGGEE